MSSLKPLMVMQNLKKKGFVQDEGDHKFFTFYHEGLKTSVWTKVSHGSKDIGDPLISCMAKQTKLKKSEFVDLVNCPLSQETYVSILQTQGIL